MRRRLLQLAAAERGAASSGVGSWASTTSPWRCRSSRCRWGALALPVAPTRPTASPRAPGPPFAPLQVEALDPAVDERTHDLLFLGQE